MESIIEDKIFELSIKKENFELIYDINQRYDSIIERLYKVFWQELYEHLKSNISVLTVRNADDWCISFHDKKWKYFLMHIEWNSDEKINYGLYTESLKYKKHIGVVYDDLSALNALNDFTGDSDDESVQFYSEYSYDFSKLSGLKKLLPDNRLNLFEEFTESINELYEKINSDLIEIEKKVTNH